MSDPIPVIIYTDGACSGNPGPGGYCAILAMPNTDPAIDASTPPVPPAPVEPPGARAKPPMPAKPAAVPPTPAKPVVPPKPAAPVGGPPAGAPVPLVPAN